MTGEKALARTLDLLHLTSINLTKEEFVQIATIPYCNCSNVDDIVLRDRQIISLLFLCFAVSVFIFTGPVLYYIHLFYVVHFHEWIFAATDFLFERFVNLMFPRRILLLN